MGSNKTRQLYDWSRFDREMKTRAKKLLCTDYVRASGLVPGNVSAHSTNFNIRCPEPAHEDRNPSCNVQPEGFLCYACGKSGDIFDLIGLIEGLEQFSEKVVRALEHQGVSYNEEREAFLEQESARITARTSAPQPPSPPKESPTTKPGERSHRMRHERDNSEHASIPARAPSRALDARAPADHNTCADHIPGLASTVWTFLLDAFTLDDVGRAFLDERQIPAAFARAHGLKSCSYEAWAVRVEAAIRRFGEDACDAAGVLSERKRAHPYLEHMLLLPSYHEGRLAGLRFRRLSHDVTYGGVKYLSLRGSDNQVEMPFLATRDGLPVGTGLHRGVLYVVEGELDTLSIRSVGRAAIGAPGALTWRPGWVEGWTNIPHVVILKDADPDGVIAAERFVGRISSAASSAHGEAWCEQRLHELVTPSIEGAKDANDLLMISEDTLVSALESFEELLVQ